MNRALGYRPDKRYVQPHMRAAPGSSTPPPKASNVDLILDVFDQGQLGTCVLNMRDQVIRGMQIKAGVKNPPPGSRLFGYYNCLAATGDLGVDAGTFLHTAFEEVFENGFCPEAIWPYSDAPDLPGAVAPFKRRPSEDAYRAAYDQRLKVDRVMVMTTGQQRVDDVKRALAAGYLVGIGTAVSQAFCNDEGTLSPIPPPIGAPIAGNHALTLYGYDGYVFDGVNSWGTLWGQAGYFQFTADYIAWPETTEIVVVRGAPNYSGV